MGIVIAILAMICALFTLGNSDAGMFVKIVFLFPILSVGYFFIIGFAFMAMGIV